MATTHGNRGLEFRVGNNTSDPWDSTICYTTETDTDSFWFHCGETGLMFCVTRDPLYVDVIEICEVLAFSEYFIQHDTINSWSSTPDAGSSIDNIL